MTKSRTKNRPTREEFKARCQAMYNDISSQINNKKLLPGSCLPSEESLGTKYKLSRESVRNVIAQMASFGLVTRIRGKGIIVGQVNSTEEGRATVGILLTDRKELDIAKSGDFDPRSLTNRHALILSTLEHRFFDAGFKVKFIDKEFFQNDPVPEAVRKINEIVGGMVIVYHSEDILPFATAAAAKGTGVVLIPVNMRCPPLISGVSWDNYLVGRMAAEHLSGLGHRHLLCIGLDYDQLWVENRISGFKDYCNENSIRCDIFKARSKKQGYPISEISREIGQINAMRIVKEYKATAAFAVNDALAYGIYETLTENGIKIPEDYSIIGCDNDYALPWSGLTTFNLECIRAAETAADVIMNYLKADNHLVWPVELKIKPRLIVRESTAALRQS